MAEQYPVFIPVRDRLSPLVELLGWLESVGQHDIWLIDNASTYPPLLHFLDETPHRVVQLQHNLGHRSPWLSGAVQRNAHDRFFIVSDPDVVPDPMCPNDVLEHFRHVLENHPEVDKVGFGLRIDDLPAHYALRDDVIDWEGKFWDPALEIEPGLFSAGIDTTFAMYRPLDRRHEILKAFRTGKPYVARHLPWYLDSATLSEEDQYYRAHADSTMSNWDRDQLPWWKQRRLGKLSERREA
ncbi:MAG: glycosyltransferase family 2 protein [Ilumatobacteraceae bacterium]